MRSQTLFVLMSLSLFFVALPAFGETSAECPTLSRNLRLGSEGPDVKVLQQLLNKDPLTRVAPSGLGSAGFESTYFGLKTQNAVKRFQGLYATEVLLPAGLKSASGYVGALTRSKLTKLCSGPATRPTPPSTLPVQPTTTPTAVAFPPSNPASVLSALPPSEGFFGLRSDTPVLMFPSLYQAPRGSSVILYALGLAPVGNVVHLDSLTITANIDADGALTFTLPQNAPRGKHSLWFSNDKGASNSRVFVVTDPAIPGPVITSFSPEEGFFATKVIVKGTGFLLEGNVVDTSYGRIEGISSSDGKTLEFVVAPPIPGLKEGEDRPEFDIREEDWFSVTNDNGISMQAKFILKI